MRQSLFRYLYISRRKTKTPAGIRRRRVARVFDGSPHRAPRLGWPVGYGSAQPGRVPGTPNRIEDGSRREDDIDRPSSKDWPRVALWRRRRRLGEASTGAAQKCGGHADSPGSCGSVRLSPSAPDRPGAETSSRCDCHRPAGQAGRFPSARRSSPTARTFRAALTARSRTAPQSPQVHSLIPPPAETLGGLPRCVSAAARAGLGQFLALDGRLAPDACICAFVIQHPGEVAMGGVIHRFGFPRCGEPGARKPADKDRGGAADDPVRKLVERIVAPVEHAPVVPEQPATESGARSGRAFSGRHGFGAAAPVPAFGRPDATCQRPAPGHLRRQLRAPVPGSPRRARISGPGL